MLDFGADFGRRLTWGKRKATVLELVGDVGTGKTTFTRGLAQGLGLAEAVTSPSFTILKVYALPQDRSLVHYDFYRLPEPGIMAEDLAEAVADPRNVVVVEWGESVANLLPAERQILQFRYRDDGAREVVVNGAEQ